MKNQAKRERFGFRVTEPGAWKSAFALLPFAALLACGPTVPRWNPGLPDPDRCQIDRRGVLDEALSLRFDPATDVVLAIDVSQSTRLSMPAYAAGLSVVDRYRVPADSTRLAAEVSVACALLREARSSGSRVGLVIFSGDADPATPDARPLVAPTDDLMHVVHGIDAVFEAGPTGGTNYEAALRESDRLLRPQDGRARRIVLITDGIPTLPHLPASESDPSDWDATFDAAATLARVGTRLDIIAIGGVAESVSFGLIRSVSLETGGTTIGLHDLPR